MLLAKWLTLGLVFSVSAAPRPVEVVVVHCKEDLSWVAEYGYSTITTVLDKCGSSEGPGNHLPQRNVGREGGSYLRFIVDRYDSLADWTVFTQGEKPTYGYKGHRLGGGHLMNNVRFQDYVEAAADRLARPMFFVFSTVLVASSENMYQCLRTGYGEEYRGPAAPAVRMCGALGDWQQWYPFPEWFQDMVSRLQLEQGAPITGFNSASVLDLFQVRPASVTFFAQGARFAASREAIQSRPRAYYEGLLRHFENVDPWAGYYLEWLWFYVLGGQSAPCGFEKAVLRNHQTWKADATKQRTLNVLQATSGVSGAGNCTTENPCSAPPGTVKTVPPVPGPLTTTGGTLQLTSTTTSVVGDVAASSGGNVTLTQAGSMMTVTGSLVFNAAVFQFTVTAAVSSAGAIVFTNSTLTSTGSSGTVTLGSTAGAITMSGNTILTSVMFGNFQVLSLSLDIWQAASTCTITSGATGTRRANSAITNPAYLCGEALSTLNIAANGGAIVQSQCTATDNGAYSNTMNTLSYTAPAILRFDKVGTGSSKPILITSAWNNPSGMTLQVSNASAGAYCTQLAVYNNPGTCTTTFSSTSVDTCPDGYTCTISGSTLNSTRCQVTYCQAVSSSSNNDGLLGLIALVALLPLAALCGLAAWMLMKPPVEAPPPLLEPTMYPSAGYTLNPYGESIYPSATYGSYTYGGYGPSVMPTPAGLETGMIPMY